MVRTAPRFQLDRILRLMLDGHLQGPMAKPGKTRLASLSKNDMLRVLVLGGVLARP